MYLNIEEYADDEKEEKLLEMINMAESYQGVISEIKNEGRFVAEKSIIIRLLKKHSLEDVASLLERNSSEILSILNKVD